MGVETEPTGHDDMVRALNLIVEALRGFRNPGTSDSTVISNESSLQILPTDGEPIMEKDLSCGNDEQWHDCNEGDLDQGKSPALLESNMQMHMLKADEKFIGTCPSGEWDRTGIGPNPGEYHFGAMTGEWEEMGDEPTCLFAVSDRPTSKQINGKYIEVCVDSGCARSTTGPAMVEAMQYKPRETPQSRAGHSFVGPGGERYANKGDVVFRAIDERARLCTTKFNIAEGVEQPLGSVAEMTDADQIVLFDKIGSLVISGRSPEAAMIRRAAAKCKQATSIHRRKNNFFMPLWIQPEEQASGKPSAPFQGQGRP